MALVSANYIDFIFMKRFIGNKFFLFLVLLLLSVPAMVSQSPVKYTHVKGVVVDSLTKEPLPYAAVFLRGSDFGLQTDEKGAFEINTKVNFINLQISIMGYTTKDVFVNKGVDNDVIIEMVPTGIALKEIVIKPGKEHYSKKNNPAVEFVEKIIDRKEKYDPKNHDYFSYDKYEKMTFALNDNQVESAPFKEAHSVYICVCL